MFYLNQWKDAFKSESFTAKNIRTDRQTEVLPVGKNTLCGYCCISCVEVYVDIVIDILMPGGMKNIIELTQIVKHSVSVEELNGLFSGQVLILLVVLNTEDCKFHLFTHKLPSSHIGKD